jgi:hypothetical protein
MGRFNNIKQSQNKLKNQVLDKILSNQSLLKFLYYSQANPLLEPDIDDVSNLLGQYIHCKPKILDTVEIQQSFLIIHFTNYRLASNNTSFKESQIIFDVICHENLIENLSNGDNRIFTIIDYIDDLFNGSRGQFIGRAEYDSCRELYINENYFGYRLCYNVYDFC